MHLISTPNAFDQVYHSEMFILSYNVFHLIVHWWVWFQRFIMVLTEHLAKCESEGIDYNTAWYKWVIERLQHIFLQV